MIDVSNQQDATNYIYWSFYISSTCFGQQTRPSSGAPFDCIYSFWYNAPIQLLTGDKVEMELHLNHVIGWQQNRCIVPKAVYTVKKRSWGWTSLSPETCRAVLKRSRNGIFCILLVAYIVVLMMHDFTSSSWHTMILTQNEIHNNFTTA